MVTLMLGSPSFLASDLMASGVDLARVFREVATLCERGSVIAMSVEMRPNHVTDSSKLGVTIVVKAVESCDVLARDAVLYLMRFLMDYWMETSAYRPGWQFGDRRMSQDADRLVSQALHEAFMHVEEEEEVPRWTPIFGHVGLFPSNTTPIMWGYPSEGICMFDLFGGISTDLVTMLQACILVRKYLYVERDEIARRVIAPSYIINPVIP
ncbi:unnamed protein product [Sphagnum troendelagicum]|uniref:Uncharacterized protein n=1 Tax=Sphagnum troendelagicum TaxID=128251 RepID=A0ABP0V400_9BRYO